ncbi:hypothetical protein SDC9_192949 [bioreactor metagenome]|uniref:Uncharacterized protein n=1 Tax=bioreactor metagenome TaxID=1076179 RepID=A0A645I3N5_9ZZZZ
MALLNRVVVAEILIQPQFVGGVLLEAEAKLGGMRVGKIVRQVVAEDAKAQRVFRRKLLALLDGLARQCLRKDMDFALAFQRKVRGKHHLRHIVRQEVAKYKQFAVELVTFVRERFVQQMPHGMVGSRLHWDPPILLF